MLCVDTELKKSKIAGLGIFAAQFIPSGTVVWKYQPTLDLLLSEDQVLELTNCAEKQVRNYAYFDKHHCAYLLCGDDARFFNHSNKNNCDDSEPDVTKALRDIYPGEELTVNYKEFYGDIHDHPEIGV